MTQRMDVIDTIRLAYGASPSCRSANIPVAVAAGAALDIKSTDKTMGRCKVLKALRF